MSTLWKYIIIAVVLLTFTAPLQAQDVIVTSGLDDTIALFAKC